MKPNLLFFACAFSVVLASCASNSPTSTGLPQAAHREEAREAGVTPPLSSDEDSPLNNVSGNKGRVALKAAEF
jgi:hypothetical protein